MDIIIAAEHAKRIKTSRAVRIMGPADNMVCLLDENLIEVKNDDVIEGYWSIRKELLDEIKELGCNRVILRASEYEGYTELLKKNNMTAYIPNQARKVENRLFRGELSTGRGVIDLVRRLNSNAGEVLFKTCLDVGVTVCLGQDFDSLADEFCDNTDMVIIRENNGFLNMAMTPFSMGWRAMDWNRIMCGLRKIGSGPTYIIDHQDSVSSFPMSLRKHVEAFGKVLKEYFEWQICQEEVLDRYEKRVLFGGGRMFRNYMRNYGSSHKPLFTCDNNPALWGQVQYGIEIKNPEALKSIPGDCAIFLCNTFYDEMLAQLGEMGITNPIERFSDEFLPILGE